MNVNATNVQHKSRNLVASSFKKAAVEENYTMVFGNKNNLRGTRWVILNKGDNMGGVKRKGGDLQNFQHYDDP